LFCARLRDPAEFSIVVELPEPAHKSARRDCFSPSLPFRNQGEKNMNYKNVCMIGLLALCLALAGAVVAQRSSIDPSQHPSLAEAQQHILEATKKIHEAHERDKSDLGGHAEKAIQLLDQASMEVKSASELEHAPHK
jgi:hypothetical protein